MAGCFCEFGCNVMYDIMLMVAIVMWMVPVTWWVFRYVFPVVYSLDTRVNPKLSYFFQTPSWS